MGDKLLPRLDLFDDFTIIKIALDEEDRARGIAHIEDVGTRAFLAHTPSYFQCDRNAELLVGWCATRGVPTTRHNLDIAFRDLSEDGQLEAAPVPAAPVPNKFVGITRVREDTMMTYVPPLGEAAALDKLRDDSSLSDHQRKARDRKLTLLAGQQRRAFASQNLYR